ncbi:hypothetical protein MycrhDRAFT_5522 [Mycolicibacterium rhodesiae JS60]|nr:hypothetical protein MycrhDRAFT_5522 [Mycolicibacterium rhodesiae JS60]
MRFDEQRVLDAVADFCRHRRVDRWSSLRVVPTLEQALDIIHLKGPDRRWTTINARPCADDFPRSRREYPRAPAERAAYEYILRRYDRAFAIGGRSSHAWFLSTVVVSAHHWARSSRSIRSAYDHGLGWIIPANKDVLIVPKPILRCTEGGNPVSLHDDTGRKAIEWADGTGHYFLRGTAFGERLYTRVINAEMTLEEVAALNNADQRSIALSYMTFDRLVKGTNVRLLDVGAKGTMLYRLPLPQRIARDRVRGYGGYDYFIHMRDASHPEREFIEWVDPKIGLQRNAELCQANAFGITLEEWLSIEQEG